MLITTLAWLVIGLPLAGALLLALWPGEPDRALSRVVGVGTVATGFVLTVIVFIDLLSRTPSHRFAEQTLWQWANVDGLRINLQILVDPLSTMMMLIITGVGALIVWYSTEYMAEDRDYRRFFAEMNFFVFSMLLLVLAANFFFLIVGWAFVGLASYLLIGYYYDKPSAVAAAKKAFVINVIGDVGLVLGAFLIAKTFGTLDYVQVFHAAPSRIGGGSFTAEMICLLLFVGCAAKSAQIPLHSWLPDAMEGPTPVSALIHAATMVTAGVYLIVRCNVLFQLAHVRLGLHRGDRRGDAADRGEHRHGPGGHQARAGLVDRQPDRLHDGGRRSRALQRGDVPPADARLLQGPAVPDRRRGHPRALGRAEPEPDGRAAPAAQVRLLRDADRLPVDLRHPAVLGLLLQGRDPLVGDGGRVHSASSAGSRA